MDRMKYFEEAIKRIVAEELKLNVKDVSENIGIFQHPKWDSLTHVSILIRLEQEFDIELDETSADDMHDIQTMAEALMRNEMNYILKATEFNSADGQKLYGTLLTPDKPPEGIAVFVHGITSDRTEWGVFDRAAKKFASLNIASIMFDYRSHGESSLNSKELTLLGVQNDIEAAYEHLEICLKTDLSDKQKYIVGSSFGGGLSYKVASKIGNFKRAFLLAPVFNYEDDIKKTAEGWEDNIKKLGVIEYASLELSPSILKEAVETVILDEDSNLPAVIYHGTLDDDVPIERSEAVAKTYSFIDLLPVEGAGHVISVPEDWDMELKESWDFVDGVIDDMVRLISDDLRSNKK